MPESVRTLLLALDRSLEVTVYALHPDTPLVLVVLNTVTPAALPVRLSENSQLFTVLGYFFREAELGQFMQGLRQSSEEMLELHDPAAPHYMYLLQKNLKGLSLIRCRRNEVFRASDYYSYVWNLKNYQPPFTQKYNQAKARLIRAFADRENALNQHYRAQLERSQYRQQHSVAATAIRHLNTQFRQVNTRLGEMGAAQVECILCKSTLANVLMLPCAHVAECSQCLSNKTASLTVESLVCTLCKQAVTDTRLLHIHQ